MRRILAIGFVVGLLLLGVAGQVGVKHRRAREVSVMDEGVIATLGGFRSIAAEVIWWRAERLKEEGRFSELLQLATMLTYLQPHDAEVWEYAAWNLAYNISVNMPHPEDRWPWVYSAIKLLRDEGLRWNPGDPDICCELVKLYQLKIGLTYDSCSSYYRESWRAIVDDVARRDAWAEIGMDRRRMDELERTYGISDWGHPQASAIYWGVTGLARANTSQRRILESAIRDSKSLYERKPEPAGGAR